MTTSFSKRALRSLSSFSNASIAEVAGLAESFPMNCGASRLEHINRGEKMHCKIPRLQVQHTKTNKSCQWTKHWQKTLRSWRLWTNMEWWDIISFFLLSVFLPIPGLFGSIGTDIWHVLVATNALLQIPKSAVINMPCDPTISMWVWFNDPLYLSREDQKTIKTLCFLLFTLIRHEMKRLSFRAQNNSKEQTLVPWPKYLVGTGFLVLRTMLLGMIIWM